MKKPIAIIFFSLILLVGAIAFGIWKTGTKNQSASASVLRTGLVGHWTMDENDKNGTTYYDKSGNGRNMVSNGSPSFLSGKINQSIYFDALGEWLKYTGSLGISGNSALTLSAWVKPAALSGSAVSVFGMMGGTADTGISAAIFTTNGNVSFSTGNCSEITADNILTVGKWYHIVATKTPGLMSTTAIIYVDGVSKSLTNQYGDCTPNFTITKVMMGDGWWNADSTYPLNGSVDDVRIYNRALSATEVAQLYNSAKTSYVSAPQRASSTPVSGGKLVGWWTMDTNDMSSTGATLYDKSGLGNNGTVTGTTTSTGKIGQARNFNGSSDFIATVETSILRPPIAVSASAWVKTNSATYQGVVTMGRECSPDINGYNLEVNNTGFPRAVIYTGTDTETVLAGLQTVNDNQWHFISFTYDGANLRVYRDGVQSNSQALTGAIDYTGEAGTQNIRLGRSRCTGWANYFTGSIDDARVYNYALSAQEVANLYNASKQSYVGATVRRTGLVLDLNFGNNDGQAAPKVFDTSGNGRHATSTAGTTSPTCGGKLCDFDGGDYVTVNATNVFNSSNISIAFKFTPDFAASVLTDRMFFDTHATGRAFLDHRSDGGLGWYLGGTEMPTISLASYQLYWKQGQENVFIISGTTGNTKLYLNGTLINTAVTAWSAGNPSYLEVGAYNNGLYPFDGKIHYFKIWNRLLTDAEVAIISADRAGYVR